MMFFTKLFIQSRRKQDFVQKPRVLSIGFGVDKSVREVASKRGGGFLASKASFFGHGWPLDVFFFKLFIQSRRKGDFVQKPWFLSIGAGGEKCVGEMNRRWRGGQTAKMNKGMEEQN